MKRVIASVIFAAILLFSLARPILSGTVRAENGF